MNKDVADLIKLVDAAERAGVNSMRKLKYFIQFANSEGMSMAELAGRAKTQKYNEVQQAVIELSAGRYNAEFAPELIRLEAPRKANAGRRKPLKLTAKGKRLYQKIEQFCAKRCKAR